MSQTELIKQHLEKGNKITPLQALNLFGCLRLSGRIFDLRHQPYNMPIASEIIKVNNAHVAQYFLAQ